MQAGLLKALSHRHFLPLGHNRHLPETANASSG